ncbi:MAG: flagellar hook-associated protein FlgL [Sedimentisphaerales bacterium]|nr:flagellar hook-associated protein FlgL [Sedimentisphaerales bacterium]
MSGSLTSLYDRISFALAMHNKAMTNLQEQAATGARINRASDDPSSAYRLFGLKSQDRSIQSYIDNLADMVGNLEITDTVLQSMTSELIKCKQLVTQVTGGVYSESNRKMLASSINDHLEQLVLLANTKHAGQYLFAGEKSSQAPFAIVRDSSGQITAVTYQGSLQQRYIEAAPGVLVPSFLVGSTAFACDNRDQPEFVLSQTGARLGSGTSSVTGAGWLTVTKDSDGHFNLSIDGGKTVVDLGSVSDLTNVPVTDADGKVLYVDASKINNTGEDLITVEGTFDIFGALISIRDILQNTHSLSDQQLSQVMPKTVDWVTQITDRVLEADVLVGSRMSFMDSLKQTLQNMQTHAQDETATIEQADITQVAIDLARYQTLYQMSLAVAGKLLSVSLLDFIK